MGNLKYYFLAILSVFFWSFNVIVGSVLVNILTPWQISFFRWSIASLCLLPFTIKHADEHIKILKKHFQLVFWMALIGISLSNTFVYFSSYTISAIEMSLLGVTGPIFLIAFSRIFLHTLFTKKQQLGIILAIIGVFFIILHGRFSTLGSIHFKIGDIWMLSMALTFGFYSFLMSKKPRHIRALTFLSVLIWLGTFLLIPVFIYDCFFVNPLTPQNMTLENCAILLYMGIFNSVLAYLFWNISLTHLGGLKVGATYYLMPIFSTIEAYFILHEKVYWAQLYGGIIILLGIFLVNTKNKRVPFIERA